MGQKRERVLIERPGVVSGGGGVRPRSILLWALGLAIFLAACASMQWQPLGPRRTTHVAGAERVGAEDCTNCHEVVQGHPRIAGYHADCESCHGAGSLHAEDEAESNIRFPANSDCLVCHAAGRDTHLQWGTGEHSRAGLLCSDCHNPHTTSVNHLRPAAEPGLPFMDSASALCLQCHRDVSSRLRFPSHHPVGEGKMKCLACHDPHEDSRIRLGGRNEQCSTCHQAVTGPWIFEHPPVIEDCGYCHDPHGSVAPNLLETVQPALCLSCHSLNDQFHHDSNVLFGPVQTTGTPTFFRNCTNCHSAIHGSVTDEHLRH